MRAFASIPILLVLTVGSAAAVHPSATTEEGSWRYLHPAVFDWRFYVSHNPDLCADHIVTERQAAQHWMVFGIDEKRRAHADFSVADYLALHPQVNGDCFGNPYCAVRHLVDTGLTEGRQRAFASLPAPAGECAAAAGRWSNPYDI